MGRRAAATQEQGTKIHPGRTGKVMAIHAVVKQTIYLAPLHKEASAEHAGLWLGEFREASRHGRREVLMMESHEDPAVAQAFVAVAPVGRGHSNATPMMRIWEHQGAKENQISQFVFSQLSPV